MFVYSNGRLVEERNSSTNALVTSYLYAGSQLLATETSTATNYTVTDHLGSPRVVVNGSGTVVSRRDFLPFGEELFADGTYRKTSDNYSTTGTDAVRQRFTGYQKDTETGLDFAEARMYQNQHGRFTAIDPLLASGKSANPQTFNRYVYTMNSPLILTDPTGLQAGNESDSEVIRIEALPAWIREKAAAIKDTFEKAVKERVDYLMGAATNMSSLDQLNFERAQNRVNGSSGDADATQAMNRRLLGFKGASADSILQGATDAVSTSNDISNVNIAVQNILLVAPIPGSKSSTTTGDIRSGGTPRNIVPEGKDANHLFKGTNKLADTSVNRDLITRIANGKSLGVDKYGKEWFAQTLKDGRQIYAYAQGGVVKGAGINDKPVDIVSRYGLK